MSHEVSFKPNPDGTQDVTIVFRRVRLRPSANCGLWWMISHDGTIPQHVDCMGAMLRPKIIVKLYCKVPEKILERHRKYVVWQRIRSKSPMILR